MRRTLGTVAGIWGSALLLTGACGGSSFTAAGSAGLDSGGASGAGATSNGGSLTQAGEGNAGGSTSGGTNAGGASNGGASSGGANSGGVSNGGVSNGGASHGGVNNGGAGTGGRGGRGSSGSTSGGGGATSGSGGSTSGSGGSTIGGGGSTSGGATNGGGGSTSGGASGGGGAAGGGSCATGTVTFKLVPASGTPKGAFCGGCGVNWLSVSANASMKPVTLDAGCGVATCGSCTSSSVCLPVVCLNQPLPALGLSRDWDGTQWLSSTCGGNAMACVAAHCVPAGKYVAHMCALKNDSPGDSCLLSGGPTTVCTDVSFDLVSGAATQTVVGVIGG